MEFPTQFAGGVAPKTTLGTAGQWDIRESLSPKRLTMVMWDQAYALRHVPGGSFQDYDRVLDEAIERGYNTIRIDPMPQYVDLGRPERELHWPDPKQPFMPWGANTEITGPVGLWMIEFMEKLLSRKLHYTLSAWWACDENHGPKPLRVPRTHVEAAEMWIKMLEQHKRRFGFEGLAYVDIANEVPYFLPGFQDALKEETGHGWELPHFSDAQRDFLSNDLNQAAFLLARAFPELRFTASIHGDLRWLEVPLEFDCLDVHFYADADARWSTRTRFSEYMKDLFTDDSWHKEFSDRCKMTHQAIAPMLRARQRRKLASFAAWAAQRGMPLTTTESWSSWYYFDSPNLDWGWLLDWASWSVEDALEFGMWGWTPHNYCQPQFENWQDVTWHQRLTSRFLEE
ncbi:MAG: cellulase-like family protein [Candidatus Latescibacterota bacterium]